MLKYRLIFGSLFIALLTGLFALDAFLSRGWPQQAWLAPPGAVIGLLALILIPFALREMQFLLQRENVTISMRICSIAAILCMVWPWLNQVATQVAGMRRDSPQTTPGAIWAAVAKAFATVKPEYVVPTIISASLVGAFIMHTRHHRIEGAMANAGGSLLAIVYLGVLPGFFLPICLTHGSWLLLGIIAIVKSADIGAYASGRLIGKHKLIIWLSPGKTVEGFFGGLLLAGLVAVLVAWIRDANLWQNTPWLAAMAFLFGIVLGAVGQLGDLMESLLKRDAGVKDSGKVPGFGGILDLLDSPLLAAPAAYWLLKLLSHAS